jgi:L-erythrulose 1-phosphate isomerase
MQKPKKIFIGTSWKMNKTRAEARAFADHLAASTLPENVQLFVIPPFPYIADVAERLAKTNVLVGAQNMHWENDGPWTGEISPLMIKDCGASIVEIGHSERRTFFNETNETVALKTKAAFDHGLAPVVCIGDTREEYDAGHTTQALEVQIRALLKYLQPEQVKNLIIAYEPVWSIGAGGTPASPEFANAQHAKIATLVENITGHNPPIIYGGSVNRENCVSLASQPNIAGLFIGRAAWQPEGFLAIINAVATSLENARQI